MSNVNRNIVIRILLVVVILFISIIYTSFTNNISILEVFSQTKELPIYSVATEDKKIAISFDAAWGTEYTKDILDTLDKYEVKTTFFLVGFWVDKYPELVKEIHDRGHEIGNHSTNHPYMSKLSEEQIIEELSKTGNKIEELTGERPILFRPPYGDYNDKLIKVCMENGYYPIQWDVDSLDWKELGTQAVVDRVTRNVNNGSIVLFHNNAKYVSEYLPIVLEKLQKEGYEIVPVSKLIYKENFYMDNTGKQHSKDIEDGN
ncbi:polysaccharide deacetylase family sporulation protein PdaB [Anaerosalibacter sp. Marseille-P3206]|uniref:polysaccharide deacetylase family sporulation protein PdaB n=1 Tax=Anaerosalibacter sp. Marseille-P3206 TaxID=1871005 RepID=UPI00098472AC|nr:polysaccharide deacetylase family sporulation protein PdaB [Anaerosalibacter sp. Marseille-P3206]